MPSLSTSSSSVFGRLTGKKSAYDQAEGGALSPPLEAPARIINRHKRESSILSIGSVQELGHNIKRSVSLTSHRTNPSESSNVFGHKPRYPSTGNAISSPLTTSPIEDEEPETLPADLPPQKTRGKLSISARSLSSKFKSADHLPTLGHPIQLDGPASRPTTAIEIPQSQSSMLAAPAVPKRAPPDRPNLQPQYSFTRELYSPLPQNGVLQSAAAAQPLSAGGHNPHAIYQQIHETSAKRMATIEYLRKAHEGNIFYFGTLHYTPGSLQQLPSMHPLKLGRRANNYLILGYSLPALLDLNSGSPLEYLKALCALLQEFETYQTLTGFDSSGNTLSRGRMGQMLKSGMGLGNRTGKGRRASAVTDSVHIQNPELLGLPKSAGDATSPMEAPSPISPSGHEFQHLVTPHLPFDPDFGIAYATLCDTLIDTYAKLIDLVPTPDLCGPVVGDAFSKADKAIRKILVSNVLREFEDSTRATVKGEVAGLGKLVLGGLM